MKRKSYPIQIWFLDKDLKTSASFLTDKCLKKSIKGCVDALVSASMYSFGIRSMKFYKYYFSKERKDETISRFFKEWPLKNKPSFNSYSSTVSKWCRKCQEHYEYVLAYFKVLIDEYEMRNKKFHELGALVEWFEFNLNNLPVKKANIKKVIVPWKNLNPKFRRTDIIEGYRLQFINQFNSWNHISKEFANSGINVPDFVQKHFVFDIL